MAYSARFIALPSHLVWTLERHELARIPYCAYLNRCVNTPLPQGSFLWVYPVLPQRCEPFSRHSRYGVIRFLPGALLKSAVPSDSGLLRRIVDLPGKGVWFHQNKYPQGVFLR